MERDNWNGDKKQKTEIVGDTETYNKQLIRRERQEGEREKTEEEDTSANIGKGRMEAREEMDGREKWLKIKKHL